ncbi:MAG: hypothetical protein RL483_133 [Pseudomonadota bacterium]
MTAARAQALGGSPVKAGQILTWRATAGRSKFVMLCLMLALLAVLVRAFILQHVHVEQWQKRAENRYERIRELPAARGRLLDRNGSVIAVSIPENRLGIVPSRFRLDHPKFGELAKLLGQSPADLKKKILTAKRFFYVSGGISLDLTDRIVALKMPGLEIEQEFHRHYPLGETFANLVGMTDLDERGQEGIERTFDSALRGRPGVERVLVDRRNEVFGQRQAQAASPGEDLRLSLDANLQAIAHMAVAQALQTHKAKGAAAVMVDSRTGEILAMANAPTFNPNLRTRLDPNRVRNRAVADSFEPGSTLKPFVIAAALDTGAIRPTTTIQTAPGSMTVSGRTIRDAHAHGLLTVTEVLQKSSNIGTAKIALDLPSELIFDRYRSLGLGSAPPLSLPGAVGGRLRPWQSWVPIDKATISYGHGIAVSLVQVARAYTVFARQGDLVNLSLRPVEGPVVGEPIYSPQTAGQIRQMLELATGPGGTAPKAQIPGFKVAGKTGTAHKPEAGGYSKSRYISSFVGFVPADAPRYVIAVMVDEPSAGKHYGGDVAAPVFAQIAAESLRRLQMSPDPRIRIVPTTTAVGEGT